MQLGWKIVAVLLLISASASGIVFWRVQQLPHPADASSTQIGYWLVLKDLEEQPAEIRMALVNRLIVEAEHFAADPSGRYELTDSQLDQLNRNIETLEHAWFRDRVAQYVATAPSERRAYLKEQIAVVTQLTDLMTVHGHLLCSDPTENEGDLSTHFFDHVQSWVRQHPELNKHAAFLAVQDAIRCWLSIESLSEYPMATRRALADRIATELDHMPDIDYGYEELNKSERDLLAANTELLIEAWFYGQAEYVAQLESRSEKKRYVDALLIRVQQWNFMELLQQEEGKVTVVSGLTQIIGMAERWIDRAAEPHQQQLRNLLLLAQQRFFVLMFEQGLSSQL